MVDTGRAMHKSTLGAGAIWSGPASSWLPRSVRDGRESPALLRDALRFANDPNPSTLRS